MLKSRRRWGARSGHAMVEFALGSTILVTVFAGVLVTVPAGVLVAVCVTVVRERWTGVCALEPERSCEEERAEECVLEV